MVNISYINNINYISVINLNFSIMTKLDDLLGGMILRPKRWGVYTLFNHYRVVRNLKLGTAKLQPYLSETQEGVDLAIVVEKVNKRGITASTYALNAQHVKVFFSWSDWEIVEPLKS